MFTLDQKKAHDTTRHVSITANAGSGKTRVLVGRYCDLVEGLTVHGAVMPDRIAAITFTEKAASELRDRIAAELDARLSDEEHRRHWGDIKRGREALNSATISTIHGFCSTLLRTYPVEGNVPPNFRIVSGFEQRQMANDALMEAIEASLIESRDEEEGAYSVARRVGRERMESILRLMLSKRELLHVSGESGILARDDSAILALWESNLVASLRGMVINAETQSSFDILIEGLREELRPVALEVMGDVRRARSADAINNALGNLRRLLFTKAFTILKKNFPRERHDELELVAIPAGKAFREGARFMDASTDPALHERLLKDTRILLDVHARTIREYDRTKERNNALDFDDLQLRLLTAIADPDKRRTIIGDIRFLMIDEFQDTNELQYELARRLTANLSDRLLCIVGDTKQSIYGFRNADVEVFSRATREIEDANRNAERGVTPLQYRDEEIAPATRPEALGAIRLDASFRLLPSICAFVNLVCEPILKRRPPFNVGVDYEELVCARRSEGMGSIEILLTRTVKDDDDDDADREADSIARRIVGMIVHGDEVWEMSREEGTEIPRGARFSDIAVLCRKRSIFIALEEAFRRHRVPYSTHGGIGFFKTQEMYDILCYLRLLVNERDDVAALGVLRSPFFGVSDADLYRLSLRRASSEKGGLWGAAAALVATGHAPPEMERAVTLVRDDRGVAGRISIPMLIRRILERTGWRGAVIGIGRGEQALANVEKLIEMARRFEERGFTSLFDFVAQLAAMVDAEEMEGEAPVSAGRDAVALMTMHSAKGLEYPIVVLPSLHSPTPSPSTPIFDRDLGFAWTWAFNEEEFNPAIAPLMTHRQRAREQAEEARLLYVALTRAKDRLVLSGIIESGKEPPPGTMLEAVLKPICDTTELDEEGITAAPVPRILRFLDEDGKSEREEEWPLQIEVGREVVEANLEEETKEVVPFRQARVRIGEIPTVGSGEVISATQYLVYTLCPTRYYLQYRLGLPDDLIDIYGTADDADERESEEGSVFARVFRKLAGSIDTIAATPDSLRDRIGDLMRLEPLMDDMRDRIEERLIATIERLLNSAEARQVLFPGGSTPRVDHELRSVIEGEFLLAVIDRVLFDDDGGVQFVQYRTRRIAREDLRAAAEASLPQLRLYAYLLSAFDTRRTGVAGTILFTQHPDEPQRFMFTTADSMMIEQDIGRAARDIRRLTYGGRRDLPDQSSHCPACPFHVRGSCMMSASR